MPEAPSQGDTRFSIREFASRRADLLAVVLVFLITLPLLTKIFTSDYGTHLALGRYIVEQRQLPTPERWNYPSLGMENGSAGEWGFQALLFVVHSVAGNHGVSFLCWAVVFGIFLLIHRAIVLRGGNPLLAVVALFAFSGFLRIRIQPRPEIFTYLFTAMTIFLLCEYYFGKRKRWLYLFPPMILVWANMHPTYLMGFILSGAFFADALIRDAWNRRLSWEGIKGWGIHPVAVVLAGLAVCGLNPHGYGWLLAPLHMISRGEGSGSGNILISISELTPVKGTGMFVYYKAAAIFAAISLILGAFGRRLYILDLFLFSIAFKGAWDSARAVSMMGLFLSPGVSMHLTGLLDKAWDRFAPRAAPGKDARPGEAQKAGAKRRSGPQGSGGEKARPQASATERATLRQVFTRGRIALIAAVLVAPLAFGGTTLAFSFNQLEYGVGITEHKFSFAAAEFLRKNPVPGNMFNFFDIGGFLDWQLYPQSLTFIDGRTYNQKVFMEHQMVTGAMPGWEEILRRYEVTHVILKSMDSSGMVLPIVPVLTNDPGWSLVFADGLFVVFVRNAPELQDYIRRFNIPKTAIPQHIIWESYHYMYLGVSPIVAYQTMSNMHEMMGNRAEAIRTLRMALAEDEVPFLRSRLMQLEGR